MPFIKINSKWDIDLSVKCKTVKLIEVNIGENLDDLSYGDYFKNKTEQERHNP